MVKNLLSLFSGRKKTEPAPAYDPETEKPVIRASICTGERVAGFKDRKTGKFRDVMLIRDQRDLDAFLKSCGLDDIDTEY